VPKTKPNKSGPGVGSGATRRDRLASLEAARKKEQRRRSIVLLVVCVVLAAALLAYPVYLFAKDYQASHATLADIGVRAAAAGCDPISEHPAKGNQQHVTEGTKVNYDQTPPDSGPHYPAPAPFTKRFYTTADRPAIETLVHNLEHGYTVVWYRDSLPQQQKDQLEAISKTFTSDAYNPADKFIAAPWSNADGSGFPPGKNVVLTRWYADPSNPSDTTAQRGVRQGCAVVSGAAIQDFMAKYPYGNSPEPNGA
jgi:flagellar basal body-associated protein FliL